MKNLSNEIVNNIKKKVEISEGVVYTNDEILNAMRNSAEKYNMAHGSHSQHSSSAEY